MYYAGNEDINHCNGVAVITTGRVAKSVRGYVPVSDRVIILQVEAKPFNINIIQVYAPTFTSSEDELEKFYQDINSVLKLVKSAENTIILADFNAKVNRRLWFRK